MKFGFGELASRLPTSRVVVNVFGFFALNRLNTSAIASMCIEPCSVNRLLPRRLNCVRLAPRPQL